MELVKLGKTDIVVSRLCFGGLIIGPLQANLSDREGAEVVLEALSRGVNFIDTAELYGTYSHIKEAIRIWQSKPVIATKSYAYDAEGAKKSLEKARKGMDVDVIDIFLMHEQETRLTLRGHREAFEYYLNQKEKGIIKAVGVSTHNVEVVNAAAEMPEIDVIHPLVNKRGIGIGDGTIEDMLCACKKVYEAGKGIYSMKPLGGGNLLNDYNDSIEFVMKIPFIHSIALGMQSVEEVIMNVNVFNGQSVPLEVHKKLKERKRTLHIDFWCDGCGKCIQRCKQKALMLIDNKATVDMNKCVLCSYCASVCPSFAIKVV